MRIERHDVRDEALAEVTEGFTDRIGGAVHGQQHLEWDSGGWKLISEGLHEYASARSAEDPTIDADAFAALYSAAEAHIGALRLDWALTYVSIHLTYTGTGQSYLMSEEDEEDDNIDSDVSARDWIRTLYLCVATGLYEQNAHMFRFLASAFLDESEVLVHGLDQYLFPEKRAERNQLLDYVGSAILGLAENGKQPHPDLLQLHALLTGDEGHFWKLMEDRLREYRENSSQDHPASLLPLSEVAFAAMAVRLEGWEQPFESDYLPRRLTTGEQGWNGPRVGAYGVEPDAGALREMAGRPLVVERPVTIPDHIEQLLENEDEDSERKLRRVSVPVNMLNMLPGKLLRHADEEIRRFRYRSLVDPQARDSRQLEALVHASQYTAAAFASVASGEDHVEVTLGPVTGPLRSVAPTPDTSEGARMVAAEYAVLSGSRERLDALLSYPTDVLATRDDVDTSVYSLYRVALLAHLRAELSQAGTDGEARVAMDEAVEALERHHALPGYPPPPVILLSQLVAGNREGFALALVDALEEHRNAFSIGKHQGDSDGFVNTRILALVCLARARGWDVPVESDYLPRGVLDHAATLFD